MGWFWGQKMLVGEQTDQKSFQFILFYVFWIFVGEGNTAGKCFTTWATPQPFLPQFFSDRVSSFLPMACHRPWSSYLPLLCNWDYRHVPPFLAHGRNLKILPSPKFWLYQWEKLREAKWLNQINQQSSWRVKIQTQFALFLTPTSWLL
jgi:hypothetical protein